MSARDAWSKRQRELGNTPRAVLLRNLPPEINLIIDSWHRQILRHCFGNPMPTATWLLDLGCGYGRLANVPIELGHDRLIGLDFEAGFCSKFQADYGHAALGSIEYPPFAENTIGGAYAVTAFMYLEKARVRAALSRLDSTLTSGARVLLLEPCRELNSLARWLLPSKRAGNLTVPGFSLDELAKDLPPANWRIVSGGSNFWMTAFTPLLTLTRRWPRLFSKLESLVRWLDAPARSGQRGCYRMSLHRWILFEKA